MYHNITHKLATVYVLNTIQLTKQKTATVKFVIKKLSGFHNTITSTFADQKLKLLLQLAAKAEAVVLSTSRTNQFI